VLAIFDSVHHYPGRWIQLKKITIDFRHTKKDKYNSTKKKICSDYPQRQRTIEISAIIHQYANPKREIII
jgi:hypothetical protein